MLDVLIKGGTVVDGTGAKGRVADVGIEGGTIVGVGSIETGAAQVIDATGKVVSPGFIDIHTHNDLYVIRDDFAELFEPYLRQGITTCVANNCGWSAAPWPSEQSELMTATLRSFCVAPDFERGWESQAEFHTYIKVRGLPMNFVPLSGHGPIRIAAMGTEARFSTPDELDMMKKLLSEAMEAGCRGFSTGLTYYPGMYAHTDELVELAKVCAEYSGRYVTHVRGLSSKYDLSVAEAIDIAERSGAPLQISHVFAIPRLYGLQSLINFGIGIMETANGVVSLPGWPNPVLKKAMKRMDRGLEAGMDIGMDFIPYVTGAPPANQLYPPWALIGGNGGLLERLSNPSSRARMKYSVKKSRPHWPNWDDETWSDNYTREPGWKTIRIQSVGSENNAYMAGQGVTELAKEAGKDAFDFMADLMVEEDGMVIVIIGPPSQPWLEKVFMSTQDHPELSVGADALFPVKGAQPVQAYGCFVRILEHYVKDTGFYTLEDAIRRCTSLAASRFKLEDRGVIRRGAAADIMVFDYEKVHDNSSLDSPAEYPDGIDYVLVNGKIVVADGKYDPTALAGRLL